MTTTNLKAILLLATLLLGLNACKKSVDAPTELTEDVSAYIYGYTSGVVSKAAPIKVRFAQAAVPSEQVGQAADAVFNIKPSVKGKAVWEDTQTLRFEPEQHLKSDEEYSARVELAALFASLPDDLKNFTFNFRTRKQNLNIMVGGLQALDLSDLSKQQIKGSLQATDVLEEGDLSELLVAKQGSRSLPVSWDFQAGSTNHAFTINGVERSTDASVVELNWNNNGKKATQEVAVRSLKDFALTNAQMLSGDEQGFALFFSDPLQKDQNLEGLIQLSDYDGNFRYLIDGNELRVYTNERLAGAHTITAAAGLKNISGNRLGNSATWDLSFGSMNPQVRLVGEGVILPASDGLLFPFEAINLNAIEVEVFKIFNNNISQFLQFNDFDGVYNLEPVGRVITQKKVLLNSLNANANSNTWTRYALDLDPLVQDDPDAIYQISIGFRPGYSNYDCGNAEDSEDLALSVVQNEGEEIKSMWASWYGFGGYYENFWEEQEDPCKPAYYNQDRFVRRNVVASNLGIIGKLGKDKSITTAVTDLRTAKPAANVNLDFLDYQQQVIARAQTDSKGFAKAELEREPFLIIARKGDERGYLKMQAGQTLSLSRFDVAGRETKKGLKGFIYGDRGVWRPGDSLFLNFILESENKDLPSTYPITFELSDSRGQLQVRRTTSERVGNIYALHTVTAMDAPTGNWTAQVKAGGATFTKILKIETVKPNRLKVNLDFGKEKLSYADAPLQANMQVNWLHGAPAQNLNTKVELQVKAKDTKFDKFSEYKFDDPARSINAEPKTVFEGAVDANGSATFTTEIANKNAPGQLIAKFKSRAFESGGDFSTSTSTYIYDPYEAYTGLYIPENKYGRKRIEVGKNGTIDFAAVSKDGKPLGERKLNVGLYRVDWRWWWERGRDNVSRYNSSNHTNAVKNQIITTDSKGEAKWTLKPDDWGRYLVRVCDEVTGHCAGDYFYSGSPWYEEENSNREALAMLAFTADKEEYEVGETVKLNVPASSVGQALVSIEDGTRVLETFWTDTKAGDNTISFKTTPEMAPTAYANVTLIQPHNQVENDLPIRMYGVIPLSVQNPKTKLEPVLKMASELKPEQNVVIEVSEKNRQPMAYTIAMVDEGLLDLTNFKTPNPHDVFYAREALGVKTWDMYKYVLGAQSGELQGILSIGGDGEVEINDDKKQANRFKPVVRHIGPFYLAAGKKAKHTIKMPNYIGSVRTMLVAAGNGGACGKVETTTPVRNPLMVLATLPRVLGPAEQLRLPVSVFANDPKVKNVTVTVEETSGLVRLRGAKTQQLQFSSPGEKLTEFFLEVDEAVGVANFKITAKGNGFTSSQDIEMDVRNPNPFINSVQDVVLESGKSHEFNYSMIGMSGTNTAILEVSNIPPINLDKQLKYLLRYPHGCIEQTTSGAFPQLYVHQLLNLTEEQREKIPTNIRAAIRRIKQFQLADGAFAYWPGGSYASEWGTNYAGHFLLEAQKQGYQVDNSLLNRWKKHQQKEARIWTQTQQSAYRNRDLMQAYRLYTLALANAPDLGSMNRLRESGSLSEQGRWRLAAAYALAGKKEVAQQLLNNASTEVKAYRELGYSYGSDVRDQAMILESLLLVDDKTKAVRLVRNIAKRLSQDRWHSTQTIAYSLMAISKFAGGNGMDKKFQFAYQATGQKRVSAGSDLPIMNINLPTSGGAQNLQVENLNDGPLYAQIILTGQPVAGNEVEQAKDLNLSVEYKDTEGNTIDVSQLEQGTDFVAEVTVKNPNSLGISYEELALTQIFPSGWEILNSRVDNFGSQKGDTPEYKDVRDDRVYSYFDLPRSQQQTYHVQLNAAYQGRYYLPAVECSAMYDETIAANTRGQWVEVVQAKEG